MHIYTYMYIHKYACVYVYIHIYVYVYIYLYIHTYICAPEKLLGEGFSTPMPLFCLIFTIISNKTCILD